MALQRGATRSSARQGPKAAVLPPPHNHPWDEAFYVIAGQVTFGIEGDDNRAAPPGTLVQIPGGSMHWFRFGLGGGEMISIASGAGAAAFFTEVDRKDSPTEPDLDVVVGIASSHGLTMLLPSN